MHVPIGQTLDGRALRICLDENALVVIIGDPRSGRTTIARHLARCWLADLSHRLFLEVDRTDEYADLARLATTARRPAHHGAIRPPDRRPRHELTVHDRQPIPEGIRVADGPAALTTDPAPAQSLVRRLSRPPTHVIAIDSTLLDTAHTGRGPTGLQDDLMQGRLDLPACTCPLRVNTFGVVDRPPHRWQMTRPTLPDQPASTANQEELVMSGPS